MLDTFRKEIPLLSDYQPDKGVTPTNSQMFRIYVERYLNSLPVVNTDLDLIISQLQSDRIRQCLFKSISFPVIKYGKSMNASSRIYSIISLRWCLSSN